LVAAALSCATAFADRISTVATDENGQNGWLNVLNVR